MYDRSTRHQPSKNVVRQSNENFKFVKNISKHFTTEIGFGKHKVTTTKQLRKYKNTNIYRKNTNKKIHIYRQQQQTMVVNIQLQANLNGCTQLTLDENATFNLKVQQKNKNKKKKKKRKLYYRCVYLICIFLLFFI
jgi:hypothetical protein